MAGGLFVLTVQVPSFTPDTSETADSLLRCKSRGRKVLKWVMVAAMFLLPQNGWCCRIWCANVLRADAAAQLMLALLC